jgi:hypothetical protein
MSWDTAAPTVSTGTTRRERLLPWRSGHTYGEALSRLAARTKTSVSLIRHISRGRRRPTRRAHRFTDEPLAQRRLHTFAAASGTR